MSRPAGERTGAPAPAAVRATLVPVVALGELLVRHPAEERSAFWTLLAAFAAWAAGVLAAEVAARRARVRVPAWLERGAPFVDLAAIVTLTYTSGGPFSETGLAFFVLPLLAAARLRPDLAARWAAASVGGYLLLSLLHPTAGRPEAISRMISQVAYLSWAGLAATLLSSVLARRDAAIAALAAERGQLAVHALEAEQRERRRLAELLHDEAVQTLALAQQELGDYRRSGREPSFERARTAIAEAIAQLRGEIFELYPYVLDHAGLAAALSALADRSSLRTSAAITVSVEAAATGVHDELLVVLARELLANAVKHSGASLIAVTVAAQGERIALEVRDDGSGFSASRRAAALRGGHIGLASSERRAQALGGELSVDSAPGRGTNVRVTLPR